LDPVPRSRKIFSDFPRPEPRPETIENPVPRPEKVSGFSGYTPPKMPFLGEFKEKNLKNFLPIYFAFINFEGKMNEISKFSFLICYETIV